MRGAPRTISIKATHTTLTTGRLLRLPSASPMPIGIDIAMPKAASTRLSISPPMSCGFTGSRPGTPSMAADQQQHHNKRRNRDGRHPSGTVHQEPPRHQVAKADRDRVHQQQHPVERLHLVRQRAHHQHDGAEPNREPGAPFRPTSATTAPATH